MRGFSGFRMDDGRMTGQPETAPLPVPAFDRQDTPHALS